jgi:hypothetical protein
LDIFISKLAGNPAAFHLFYASDAPPQGLTRVEQVRQAPYKPFDALRLLKVNWV